MHACETQQEGSAAGPRDRVSQKTSESGTGFPCTCVGRKENCAANGKGQEKTVMGESQISDEKRVPSL